MATLQLAARSRPHIVARLCSCQPLVASCEAHRAACRKLDAARRALGVTTETEAIDLALDFVVFRREVADGIAAMRRVGGIEDLLEPGRRP